MQISDYNLSLFVVHDDDDDYYDDYDGGGNNNQQQSKEFSSCMALICDALQYMWNILTLLL